MGRRAQWESVVDSSMDEACLAVRLYNDPSEPRSFEGFVVHMHLAWLYLLHAEFTRDSIDFRYWNKEATRLIKVDGEPKRWELAKCAEQRWAGAADPIRANIEFFIALRNKIEHRYTRQQEQLALAVGGHAQALLLNYEQEITSQFGPERSLATRLRFPVFIGTFTDEGARALLKLRATLPKPLQKFLATYTTALDPDTARDPRFEFRIQITQTLKNTRDPNDLPIEFIPFDHLTPEQRETLSDLGGAGKVFVKEKSIRVVNHGWFKTMEMIGQVQDAIPFKFNVHTLKRAYLNEKTRPPRGDAHPEKTDERYCVYDLPHRDYLYSPAYIKHLIKYLSDEEGFRRIVGIEPMPKPEPVGTAGEPHATAIP